MSDLLRQGLAISVVGLALVFAGLALLWAAVAVMGAIARARLSAQERAARESTVPAVSVSTVSGAPAVLAPVDVSPRDAASQDAAVGLTQERARVAAMVAGALLANALPIVFDVPTGPVFEHGRTAPLWVAANRARALPTWQPARRPEAGNGRDAA
jgi:Na+-transporting methylmalonyl-CoA/oxaloacetate decarboxylase gamma subunit